MNFFVKFRFRWLDEENDQLLIDFIKN